MTTRTIGWLFVVTQVVLLLLLLALPTREHWPTPGWVVALSALLTLGGMAVIAIAIVQLGRALTPTPVPNARGDLVTSGLYGVVRHPVYSGLMVVVLGVALRSGSWFTAAVAVVTIVFFTTKARWEEHQLAIRYEGYLAYAQVVPRFVPTVSRPQA